MPAHQDRRNARRAISRARMASCCTRLVCLGPAATVQYLDVRVRDAGNVAVDNAAIAVTPAAGGMPAVNGQTDAVGDVIIPMPVGAWNVEGTKDWFVPEPAQAAAALVGNQILIVNLQLDELRYYLHVDADRDGGIDPLPQPRGPIAPWQWGAAGRGAIVLCNNDYDGPAVPLLQRQRDNANNVVEPDPDTREIARIEIRRVGPATAPSAAANWTATLAILGGHHDKLRIFDGSAAGSAQLLGAASPAGPAVAQHAIPLRTAAPASYAGAILGVEAVTYPRQGFDGCVQVELTISRNGSAPYSAGAELRIAPWLATHHAEEARRVYVADLGPDIPRPGRPDHAGNSGFRAALNAALNGTPLVQIPHAWDRWMQDCMEIGYSVLPLNAGGTRRQRVEAVLQTYRDQDHDDLKAVPRSLLARDFGYQESLGTAGAAAAALAGAAPVPVYVTAQAGANAAILAQGALPVGLATPIQARDAAAAAVEQALRRWGSVDKNAILEASAAVQALGAPWNAAAVADAIANAAVRAVADPNGALGLYAGNTLDSGGNLECTPPCQAGAGAAPINGVPAGGKDYPWGRIYFGGGTAGTMEFDAATRAFLEAQWVQAPISLDTSWLEVGHVDEMMSFIPAADLPMHAWRLLMASPRRAYHLLGTVPHHAVVLQGRQFRQRGRWRPVNTTANVLLNGAATPILAPRRMYDQHGARIATNRYLSAQQLNDYNLQVIQPRLDAVVNQLVAEIGLVPAEVIEVPVIFAPGEESARLRPPAGGHRRRTNLAGALTADMVNMLVVNDRCIVPDPFGPIDPVTLVDVFQQDLTQQIAAANVNLTVTFIDDWYSYHCNMGEVHCGTNTNRHPANLATWLGSPAAAWWTFQG
jgi:hypothetical protein